MSHITRSPLHAYANRGLDLRVSITTAEEHTDFTSITFRVAGITKSGLTASDTATGFDVDLTLTASDLGIAVGVYQWELKATFAGEVRTIAQGPFTISEAPTT